MIRYKVEFTLKFNNALKSLVIVADPKDEEEFLDLCVNVYSEHFSSGTELLVYFFRNIENARKFTRLRIVDDVNEITAVNQSRCIGRIKDDLFTFFNKVARVIRVPQMSHLNSRPLYSGIGIS